MLPSGDQKLQQPAEPGRGPLSGVIRNQRFGMVLFLLGSVFFVYSLRDSLTVAGQYANEITLEHFIAATLAATAGMYVFGSIFYRLLQSETDSPTDWWRALAAYNLSAIARYVPGRIWGVFYQIDRLGNPKAIVKTNIRLAAVAVAHSTGTACSILLYYRGGAFVPFAHYLAGFAYLVTLIFVYIMLVIRIPVRLDSSGDGYTGSSVTGPLITVAALPLEWLTFVFVWHWLLSVDAGWQDVLVIASAYSLAWIVGIVFVVFPAGLIAREGSFILAGEWLNYSTPKLLFWAASARCCFTLAEFSAALTSFALAQIMRRRVGPAT